MKLAEKVVILTGASQGIGRAAIPHFLEAGCYLVLVARSADKLKQLAAEYDPKRILIIPADVSEIEAAKQIITNTIEHFGRVDILVNNAAIGLYGLSMTVPLSEAEAVMQVNFWGPFYLMQACLPHMQTHDGGLIINVLSIVGRRSTPKLGTYCASKAALEHLVESMRVELATTNIRFSSLYPGVTKTSFTKNALGQTQHLTGRLQGVSADRVAKRLVRVAQREPRDAYVTLIDWLYVFGSKIFPSLVDWGFTWYFMRR